MKKNKELARIFERIADALEFKGANVFKVVAYRKAARVLDELTRDIEEIHRAGKLQELSGIGAGIAKKIDEYLRTGKMKKYEEATKDIPDSLLDLLDIQNLGPKTLALANKKLNVKNLVDLKRVIKNGTLAKLPQMGEKKVENIKKGIELFERAHQRLSLARAREIAFSVVEYLKRTVKLKEISPAGSLRRGRETVGDIDILTTGKDGARIIEVFTSFPQTERILAAGDTKGSIIVEGGVQVDLRIVPLKSYGSALQYFTGSKAHNVKLRNIARQRGMKLSEYGLFKGRRMCAGKREEDVYKALGLDYIPPELREDRGEIEKAQMHKLPRLIEKKDIHGDLHIHSNYSDSNATIEQLVRAGEELGYEYILISDHSVSARYAHGLDLKRLHKQWEEIDRLNKKFTRIKMLKGLEVDILKDGKLDFSDEVLKNLDLVIASVHQGFTRNVTERICAAMDNPYVDIIGHPTGRLISSREGYQVDIHKVIEYAAETRTWLELNAYWDRLDLNDVNLRAAKEAGVKISIGTDAHGVEGLSWMGYGITTARRGWLEPGDVVNTYTVNKLLRMRKRQR